MSVPDFEIRDGGAWLGGASMVAIRPSGTQRAIRILRNKNPKMSFAEAEQIVSEVANAYADDTDKMIAESAVQP